MEDGAGGTSGQSGDDPPAEPAGYQDDLALVEAPDENPDPDIVEVAIEARPAKVELLPGLSTEASTYNGLLPGPLIRVQRGNRLIVHFKNSLSEPTTIHWHGVRVPANMDGAPTSQDPVPPGGTFDYDFRVPDASLFWYHPHFDSTVQVSQGLYGPLLVDDPAEPRGLGDEVVLVLSDIDLRDDGGLAPVPVGPIFSEFGTEGNVILVNGRPRPRLLARAGLRQRWRIVNAARSRFFQLVLPGNSFERIGVDGGLLEAPQTSDKLVIAPGERVDVSIVPRGKPGADIVMQTVPYDRGYGTAFGVEPADVLVLHLDSAPPVTPAPLPGHLRTIEPIETSAAHPKKVTFGYAPDDAGVYQVNDGGSDAMVSARVGDIDVWTVDNQTDWDHPFHLHGFFFQPLDDAGQPLHEWKDTLNVPAHQTGKFVVEYDDRPGDWMFHCHILEHADVGLMGMLMLSR